MRVENLKLEVLPVEELTVVSPNHLHFVAFEGEHCLYFDISKIKDAEQWDIAAENGFCVWEEDLEWKLEREKIEEKEKSRNI